MAGQLRFAVLGPVRAWRDDAELDLGTPLQRSILAMLLLREGRAVTPNELIDAVWGEEAPPRALGALRTYVSRLRTALEPDRSPRTPPQLLTSVGKGYALRLPDGAFDLARFEKAAHACDSARKAGELDRAAETLREALAWWSGEPLAGAVGPYAESQRERLLERRISAVETLMGLDLDLGRHAEIISELMVLTADHPLRERLRAQLMLAYYRCGRQAEALNVFTDTRNALIEELGIDPGTELTDLHRRVLAADPTLTFVQQQASVRLTPDEPAEPQPVIEMPKPAQLPAAVTDFTGRKALVNRLLNQLGATDGVPIAAICGIGGVGKTTLAVHVAHLLHDTFPDGQLYADLRGYGREPTSPETALAAFLRALGIPVDVIPDGLADRAALFRSLLGDRRMLVLLDNARDADQVEHLLPGAPGCAALITSRGKLADLPAAKLLDLDVMEPDEALALFSAVAGPERVAAERAAAMDVVAACGFLPLAVRIVAARLASRPSWTVASLVPRLADERRRLDELKIGNLAVSATFALGYGQLDPRQARAFRLLSLPNGTDISTPAAAAVLDLNAVETEDVLESMVDVSLLEAPAPGRYRFHDLLRLFARRQAEDGETAEARGQALHRLLGFYLGSARAAHRLAYEGSKVADNLTVIGTRGHTFGSADESVAWLAAEADDLFALLGQVAEERADVPAAADLLVAMEPLLEAGAFAREFDLRTRALIEAGDDPARLRARYVRGRMLFGVNRLSEADQEFRTSLEIAERTGDHALLGETYNALGVVTGRLGRHPEALDWFGRATKVYRELGNLAGEALVLSYSARDLLLLGRAADAVAVSEQGLQIFGEIGSGPGVARARYHLGVVLSYVGRLNEAVVHHAECLEFFRASNQKVWEQRVCNRLATTLTKAERFQEAARHAEQALQVSREITHPYGEAQSLTALGKALRGLGSRTRSRDALEKALDLFIRLGSAEADDVRKLLADRVET
ncbi:AfsR/SARP family transcriptional regulator [Herbidospora daliensis]|uniref:AfsR/SARP family transcriptional regulator n=1 Tax=Herbidospora daliensis TaxID=295585 RepID=UPI000784E8AA|nr:BTAD domain-containing putative transcriptional regulator [Herbidospora daliensis]